MSDFLCFGDFICLYCEETEGYVYCNQTSSAFNSLYVNQWQDREKPKNVPCPQAIQFQICIQNRYKLNKKYRKLMTVLNNEENETLETKAIKAQAKFAADAEFEDNVAEQKRQHGKRVRYGEVIQLRHVFTEKFIHVSTTQTSRRDKNNMLVHLLDYNAKHGQVKILPRYKVKTEGESVQIFDQIIFESVKSPGQYFHASAPWKIDNFSIGSELNLGVQPAGFTVVKSFRPTEETKEYLRGGSVIRLFHKELEAFVVAEGLFDDEVTEDVHLRIREVDQLVPKSLYPTTSGNTYLQVETEASLLNGDVIRWEQQLRFRHLATRQYLCITTDRRVTLTPDSKDPRTVFRLHPVIKEVDEIIFDSYTRIEHVITGYWLHALRDEEYIRRCLRQGDQESGESLKSLRWDAATLRKISASGEKVYHDAYTMQVVEPPNLTAFNYAAGMVPFLLNHILDRNQGKILNAKKAFKVTMAMEELKNFMIIKGVASKKRQKLMRNLRLIDLLVRVLEFPLQGASDQTHLTRIFKGAYDVLYTYMIGNSRKNALYFAKYIDFFQTQITVKVGDIGLNVAKMIAELIRDNRKIVDRISQEQIELFVGLLKLNKNYRYLDLLNVLCVCNGVAIPNNQTYICEHWLRRDTVGMRFLTERGQNVNGQPNIIYVSSDNGAVWTPLHEFVNKDKNMAYHEEDVIFFEHQLDLYGKLAYGRNDFAIFVITRELGILTWDEAFLSLRSTLLPEALRAKYCELIISLFIDVGTNYSVLDHTNLSFIYEDILSPGPNADGEFVKKSIPAIENWLAPEGIIKDLVTLFPVIRDWIAEFLVDIKDITASEIGQNMLIEQVLRLFHFLVKFGYYGSDDIKKLLKPLLLILDCKHDKPFPPDTDKGTFSKEAQKMVQLYRTKDRFEPSNECQAVVNAKYQAMEVLDLLLTFQFNSRLESFIAKFKTAELASNGLKGAHSLLCSLLNETYDPFDMSKKGMSLQKRAVKELRSMFDTTAYFDTEQITSTLMDLSNYKYDKMINKSLSLLNKFYSAKTKLFKLAIRAMVLITTDSCHVHREVARTMPILRRYSKAKLNDDQVKTMGAVLDTYAEFCHLPKEENEKHPMNQNILINHEVLTLVFDMLTSEIDAKLMEQYRGLEVILKKCLKLLKALARSNDLVQMRIFERLDILLKIKVVESEVAVALKEAFIGNQSTCLKILPQQIQSIVDLISTLQEKGFDFIDLLNAIVKVEGLGLTLKRNQAYVMKYVMQDYNKLAHMMDQPREHREKILLMEMGVNHLKYLISFIDLLATCSEGENRFIESMCQTILSVDELLWVINHPEIDANLKKPFMNYFLWVYMKTAGSAVESGAGDLPHDQGLWNFFHHVSKQLHKLTEFVSRNPERIIGVLKKAPGKYDVCDKTDSESVSNATLHYMFDAVMPILQAFYTKFYQPEKDTHPEEVENTDKLARALVGFCEAVIPLVTNPSYNKAIISCITSVLPISTIPSSIMEGLIDHLMTYNRINQTKLQNIKGHKEYYEAELLLNGKLRVFAVNCSLLYGGYNLVQAQLKIKSKRDYTEIGGDEELPLGEEFQEHLRRFLRMNEKKVEKRLELIRKLVTQLAISWEMYPKLSSESLRIEQEELDIRSLHLLRAVVHNEERKLPENWEEDPAAHKKHLAWIRSIQVELNEMGAVTKALPHLARPCDRVAKEVLAFVSIMLFNANEPVQTSLLNYFWQTREESFFAAIRSRIHLSALAIKEKRSLAAQQRARAKEAMSQTKSMQTSMAAGKKALQEIQAIDNAMKKQKFSQGRQASLSTLQSHTARRKAELKGNATPKKGKKSETEENQVNTEKLKALVKQQSKEDKESKKKLSKELLDLKEFPLNGKKPSTDLLEVKVQTDIDDDEKEKMAAIKEEEEFEEIDQKDDGYIKLVLCLLARMCDGQHGGLQDYLREQPDNLKSFNIIAETAQFVNLVYSNITSQNIELCIQLFETLNEFTVGNQQNRAMMLNSKVVDYVNFILRAAEFKKCKIEKVLMLKITIGNLIMSMIEENTPESLLVAKETKDTLDKEALYRCMTNCYEATKPERKKIEGMKVGGNMNVGTSLQSTKNLNLLNSKLFPAPKPETLSTEVKEQNDEVGFVYYLIIARTYDLDPKLCKKEQLNITPMQLEAFNHYKKNTMSIEVLKDDCLQKINFRVKNKNVLRDEVKEKMTWSVDRSSPSNKIRDMMKWSRDILKDIYYQRKILSNSVATFFTKQWILWNQIVILLSVAINALMLYTWQAPASLDDTTVSKNAIQLPPNISNPHPKIEFDQYDVIILALGGAHNLFCVIVLVTYFLSNHPTLPKVSALVDRVRKIFATKSDEETEVEKVHESKLEIHFLSFTTFYYVLFMALSILGTVYKGYFFAFHLLNIVNNNQLLKGVIIQAVLQNGRSLLWVAVLGFVIFYLYGLVSFAFFRSSFDSDNGMYCATLWQCTLTVIRYGLVSDLFERLGTHNLDNSFFKFGLLCIFHLSFFVFITTIGLNVILGIIVDTFSELRDLKWTAERDMRDTCFICSRGSYDFEHHGVGFENHINNEHHIWAYIFFFIHLHDTKQCDYTSLELYVFRLLQHEKFDFFPLNRALSLSLMDEGSTDSKVDDLLQYVLTLVERQKEEDAKNKREEERQKQLRWREENRNALLHPGRDAAAAAAGGDLMATGSSDQSNDNGQSFAAGQLLRQKRWHHDLKQSKLLQSVDTQDSSVVEQKPRGGGGGGGRDRVHSVDDLLGDGNIENRDLPPGYTKTGTLPLEVRSEVMSQRSSPLAYRSGAGPGQRSTVYSSMDLLDDAPVHSIEFDEEDGTDIDLPPSPSVYDPHHHIPTTDTTTTSLHSESTPSTRHHHHHHHHHHHRPEARDDYEAEDEEMHPVSRRHAAADEMMQISSDDYHRDTEIDADFQPLPPPPPSSSRQIDIEGHHPPSSASPPSVSSRPPSAKLATRPPSAQAFPIHHSPPAHEQEQEEEELLHGAIGGRVLTPLSSDSSSGLEQERMSQAHRESLAAAAAAAKARRDSVQSTMGRRPTQARLGMEDFGLLTEDPFEITAPKAEFDEGLIRRDRRASSVRPATTPTSTTSTKPDDYDRHRPTDV